MTDPARSTTARHAARLAVEATELPADRRPEPGPIAVLPEGRGIPVDTAALEALGATVGPLDAETRGVVFTSASQVGVLIDALETSPRLGWVQLPFAGIDMFAKQLRPFAERGVVFTSAKGAYSQPVAEHALALILAMQRVLPMRARATSWGKARGESLYGAHVLILGAGGIALELIDQLAPFGVTVTVGRRRADEPVLGAARTVDLDGFRAAIPEADVIVLAAAATDATRGLMGEAEFRAMRPTAVLVNIARGPLVDTDALVRALDDDELYGAALDVTDPEPLPEGHPLFSHPRSLVTPHTADTPEMVGPLFQERVERNVEAFLRTGRFVGLADPVLGY